MDFTLCLTHACNLRCAYCYAGEKSSRRMSWKVAQRAVDFCLERAVQRAPLTGCPAEAQLGFFGGEPLLEWELLQRATIYAEAETSRLGIDLKRTVTTNMSLLDEARATWLRAHSFHVGLSLDGNETMHDTLRRSADGRGSHAACAAALEFYRGADAGAEVIVVIDPRNVGHLADSVAWLLAQDIRRISLNPNFYIEWPEPALAVWREASETIGDLYIASYLRGVPVRINVIDGKIRTHTQDGYAACDHCGFGEYEIAIAASGNIYPCERLVADDAIHTALCIGNVFAGFDAVRRSQLLARRGNTVGACATCDLKPRCMNWCACINYATTGKTNQVAGIVCHHEKMVIAVADRVGATLYAESNPAFMDRFYG